MFRTSALETSAELGESFTFNQSATYAKMKITGNLTPAANGFSLGTENNRWYTAYFAESPDIGSDARLKNSIAPLNEKHSVFFDNLEPVSYGLNNGNNNKKHFGFVAQKVEEAMSTAKMKMDDFAGLSKNDKDDTGLYSLKYEEFIPLNTHEIQKLKKRVAAQDERILQLEQLLQGIKGETNETI